MTETTQTDSGGMFLRKATGLVATFPFGTRSS